MTRVTSLTQTKTKNEPIKKLTKEESAIVACSSRWKHMREEVQHKKWSECPTPMVADFVKSVAFDIEAEYGNNGASKAIEIFSCILAKENIEHFEISGAWVEGAASISIIFNKNPLSIDIEKKEIEFVLNVPIDSTEKEVREALKNWTDEPHDPRFILNPLTQLPDQNIKAILSSIEKKMEEILKNASQKMEDMDMMIGAAGLLLHWKQTELLNATNSTLTLKGLNYQKEMVWEGFEMSVDSKTQIFDKLFSPQMDNKETMEACVSISKAKSNFKKVS